jgi:hypothetical protein
MLLLRDVGLDDVAAYVRMRCDPVMTAELGGPQPRDGIEDKVRRDAAEAAAGTSLHAFPAVTNTPSNALCRSVGFRLAGEVETLFAGRTFRANHWFIDPRTDLG